MPIPSNDDAVKAIELIGMAMVDAVKEGHKRMGAKADAEKAKLAQNAPKPKAEAKK